MADLRHVLCPVDFSDTARTALAYAGSLATWYEAALTVLHVYTPPALSAMANAPGTVPVAPLPDPQQMERELREFCAGVGGLPAVRTMLAVTATDPVRVIAQHAAELPADLVVMGTHGRGGFERLFLGSVAAKVLRSADVPVLTVPPGARAVTAPLFKTILCAMDFSDASLRALEYALLLARDADARVVVMHAVEGTLDDPRFTEVPDLTIAEYLTRRRDEAQARLEQIVPGEAREWSRPEVRVVSGRAQREILRLAAELPAEVIVMGASGRGALDRWLFGSTTDNVVRRAGCPVLTLREPEG